MTGTTITEPTDTDWQLESYTVEEYRCAITTKQTITL